MAKNDNVWIAILTAVAVMYNDYAQHTPATGQFRWDLLFNLTVGIGANLLILWIAFKLGNWLYRKAKGKKNRMSCYGKFWHRTGGMGTSTTAVGIVLVLLAGIYVPCAYAAAPDPSSVVEIKVWDAIIKDYSGSASGILLSDTQVLTDYHVAKFAIDNPKRYQLVICLSSKINTLPDCVYAASPPV